ncbi:MAG TPA: hypothetical protein VMM93_07370 [Vicinamibacterales bacterium]|nr:hypothetical protein [Vicinamibacterales bacterium]
MKIAGFVAGAVLFVVLATANAGGYRYGVSDQAYYLPAVALAANPDLFPRDRVVLATQTGLMAADDALAAAVRLTGLDLPTVFLVAYALTLVALYGASIAFARALGLSWWATAACVLLLTFRHRIARTGANSLEGYMHPRQLAFALGVAAWACLLRDRLGWAAGLTLAAGLVHPTTGLWFAATVAVAVLWRLRMRPAGLAAAAVATGAVGIWAAVAGPLAGRFVTMDAAWLAVLADKDYLFPAEWPLYAWATNLGAAAIIGLLYHARRTGGFARRQEAELVAGLAALVAAFVLSVPLTEAHLAVAVQLQVNRVFWLLDFVLAVYLAWWLTSGMRWSPRAVAAVVVTLAVLSAGRGAYLLTVEHAERGLVTRALPATAWVDAMRWVAAQPIDWHVLADPDHGWKYGVSVRAAGLRDTVLETGKDTAMAMYDRDVALRVADRLTALSDFERLSTADLRRLDDRYDLDVAVLSRHMTMDLPVLYQNDQFVVYDLR